MKVYLRDQGHQFANQLHKLKKVSVTALDKTRLWEKTTVVKIEKPIELNAVNLKFFFQYEIFPSHIMKSLTQWSMENREIKLGDTILQQVFVPPLKFLSVKILFGVRINSVIDEPNRKGFSYQTLTGHVETGESVFLLEKTDDGVVFKIQTFSAPGNWVTNFLAPIITLPYQSYCTRLALDHVKKQLAGVDG